MEKKTVILTNNKTGQQYHVTESEAKATLSNPLMGGVYTKTAAPEVPDEVSAMRKETTKTVTPQTSTQPPKETTKEATNRQSPGNENK